MNDFLLFCGVLSPLAYIAVTVIGGALRPGYSHTKDTVSELFTPGSPNKPLLNKFIFGYSLLTTLFGVGIWQFVSDSGHSSVFGLLAAGFILLMGIMNFATGFFFLQDPMGKPITLSGVMHIALVGIMAFLSLATPILLGRWMITAEISSSLGAYSFFTAGAILAAGLSNLVVSKLDKPLLGLAERVTIGFFLQWSIVVSLKLMTL